MIFFNLDYLVEMGFHDNTLLFGATKQVSRFPTSDPMAHSHQRFPSDYSIYGIEMKEKWHARCTRQGVLKSFPECMWKFTYWWVEMGDSLDPGAAGWDSISVVCALFIAVHSLDTYWHYSFE